MPEDDDPIAHGHEAAVQVATVLATVAGEMTRRSASRIQSHADEAARTTARDRVQRATDRARDAVRWSPMLDRDFRGVATTVDSFAAWAAASRWADTDPQAARACRLAETVLRRTAPEVMAVFDAERARGVDTRSAMATARDQPRVTGPMAGDVGVAGLASAMVTRADLDVPRSTRRTSASDASATPAEQTPAVSRQDGHGAGAPSRSGGGGTTLDARRQAGLTVDFPVVITTVPIRATPTVTGAVAPPETASTSTRVHRPGLPR